MERFFSPFHLSREEMTSAASSSVCWSRWLRFTYWRSWRTLLLTQLVNRKKYKSWRSVILSVIKFFLKIICVILLLYMLSRVGITLDYLPSSDWILESNILYLRVIRNFNITGQFICVKSQCLQSCLRCNDENCILGSNGEVKILFRTHC